MVKIAIALAIGVGLLATGASASTELVAKTVSAQANIFGAGRMSAPEPGGGGGGVLPPAWRLPKGASRVVTFPRITGKVTPIVGEAPYNGPGGDHRGPTNIESLKGISGIMHFTNGMFLVGVFLTDSPPKRPAPPRIDFTETEQFETLAPRIGQTFLIGDGKGRSYKVPAAATRLFVGFVDGFFYQGAPGWYGNNAGRLRVAVELEKS
jgi:hypothetical protein